MSIILFLLCLSSMIALGETCSCWPMSNEEKACASDFVFTTKVKSDLIGKDGDYGDHFYKIRKPKGKNIIKFDNKHLLSGRKLRRVYTASNSAMCGVSHLQKGTTYLFSGMVNQAQQRLEISLCVSWIEEAPISKSSKLFLRELKGGDDICEHPTTIPGILPPSSPMIVYDNYEDLYPFGRHY